MIRVFVYGTLKRKQSNHYIIEATDNGKAIFIGDGTTEKKYPLVYLSQYGLPFLLHVEGEGKVRLFNLAAIVTTRSFSKAIYY